MADIIRDYEQDYATITADLTAVTSKLKIAASTEVVEEHSSKILSLFNDAKEILEQIEIEVHQMEPKTKAKFKTRLESHQKELDRMKVAYDHAKTEANERTSRLQLFSRDSPEYSHPTDEFNRDQQQTLLDNAQLLENSSRHLDTGHKLLLETEEVGASVLEDLTQQRETIQRSRTRLREAHAGLGQSQSVLSKMVFRAQQNKIVLLVVFIAIAVLVLIGIYKLFT